jgi:hypothetical protein
MAEIPPGMRDVLKDLGLGQYTLRGLADCLRELARSAPPEWRVDVQPEAGAILLDRLADVAGLLDAPPTKREEKA